MKPLKKHIISKSTFIRGQQCHKSLYLNKYHKELKDELSDQQRAVFARGTNVGELAKQLFPNGLDLTPEQFYHFIPSIEKTKKAIEDGVEVIYEAAFQHEGVLVLMDVLVKNNNKWYAYEVKSASNIKGVYIQDASLQYYVIHETGLVLEDICIVHLNSKYEKEGKLDIQKLFKKKSILKSVLANQAKVKEQLYEQRLVLASRRMPNVKIGAHCNTPYRCDFKGYCWSNIPDYSVFNLNQGGNKVWELFDRGVVHISEIPADFELDPIQSIQVQAEQTGNAFVKKEEINGFIAGLKYPLYFLDFEIVMPAIPLFDKTRPYQQLTFQYSLHYVAYKKAGLAHKQYLAEGKNVDPRPKLIEQLIEDLGDEGSILVYDKTVEDRCLKEMGRDFPHFQSTLEQIRTRLVDLSTPFEKRHFYTPEMKGKYSIKNVLPALVPELSYDHLEIKDGAAANFAFLDMMKGTFEGDKNTVRKNLLEYCKLDTYAMVKILEKLFRV